MVAGHQGRTLRRGLTIVELVLVLAIIAAVAAVALPTIQGPLANFRLRTAADEVRTEWCLARTEAIRSGHPCAFRCAVDAERYCVQKATGPTGDDDVARPSADAGDDAPADDAAELAATHSLPDGVVFLTAQVDDPAAAGAAADAPPGESGEWSDPIFFYPDGTASDARLTLKNDRGSTMDLVLRGVTGTAIAGDVLVGEGG
jgi:prepilin-type N-terminal cleavage/methylation domain-containing protein